MAAAILEGRFSIDDYMESIAGGSDTINAVAADTMTWREQLTVLKNQAVVALEPAIMKLFNGMGKLINGIKLLVKWTRRELGPAFQDFIRVVVPRLKTFFVFMKEQFLAVVAAYLIYVSVLREKFTQIASFVISDIVPKLREFFGFMKDRFFDVVSAYLSYISFLREKFAQIAAFVISDVVPKFKELFAFMQEKFQEVLAFIESTAIPKFKEFVEFIKEKFTEFVEFIKPKIKEFVEFMQDRFTAFMELLDGTIKPKLREFVSFMQTKFSEFMGFIDGTLMPKLKEFVGFMQDRFDQLIEYFQSTIVPALKDFFDHMQGKFDDFMVYFDSSIKPALENIKTAFITVFEAVVGFVEEHWPTIQPIIEEVLTVVKETVETTMGVITGIIDALIRLIGGDFSGAWKVLRETVSDVLHFLVDQFMRVGEMFDKVIPLLFDVGVLLAKALLNGLKTIAGKIGNWLLDELEKAFNKLIDKIPVRWRAGVEKLFGGLGAIRDVAGTALSAGDIAKQRAESAGGVASSFATASAGYRDAMMLSRTGRNTEGDQYIINITGIIPDMVAAGEKVTEAIKAYKDNGGSTDDLIGAS